MTNGTMHRAEETRQPAMPDDDPTRKLFDQLGGPKGMVYTAIPVAAFILGNAVLSLPLAIGGAIAMAVALMVFRMTRGEPFAAAASGLSGVVAAGAVSAWTGSAGGFFLIGIWASCAGAVVSLVTLLVRRPLTGMLWSVLHGRKYQWRNDRPSLLAHDIATATLTVLFAARFAVQEWLYLTDATGWLAAAKIGMGFPLLALVLLVVLWAFRRTNKRLVSPPNH